jgi:hypothetical protein
MVKILVALVLIVVPAVSFAQTTSHTFNEPTTDVFIFRAETCGQPSPGCGTPAGLPENRIGPVFVRGFVSFRSPTTQTYQVIFIASDPEGAIGPSQVETGATPTINAGETGSGFVQFGSLGSGLYRLQVIVIGANGRAAISQPFQFRYCNAACITD